MKPKLILCLALVAFNLSSHARGVRVWSDAELMAASDLVVIGQPIKVKDLDEVNSLGWSSLPATFQFHGVETTFKVSEVLKGTPASDQIILHHYRETARGSVPNGPNLVKFIPGDTNEYLLYLKNDGTNRYAPAAGQIDPGLSIKRSPTNSAADTGSLRVVVIPSETEVRIKEKFKVALRIENPTTTNQTVRVWSCSWDEEWKTSNTNISWTAPICTINFELNVEIPPGGAYTNELEMFIPEPISEKTISFRMGFTPIDSKQTFWSDAASIGVTPQAAAVAKVKLKFVKADSEETDGQNGYGENAVDGDPNTYWHTQWQSNSPPLTHEIIIELIPPSVIKGFTYLPRQDESDHGTIKDYEFYVSNDGKDFGSPVKKGTFEPGKAEKIETFSPMKCRFIKLKAISEINGLPWTSAAEIRIIRSGEDASVMTYQINQATNLAGSAAQTQFEYETADGKVTITAYIGDGGAVSIPETINGLPVASIGWLSFGYCHKVTHVTIPNSVTSIGVGAFDGCSGMTNIAIPRTVTSVGFSSLYNNINDSFGWCENLKAITVNADNPAYSSLDGVLFNKDRTTLIQFPAGRTGSYTIPDGVTRIETKAFIGCGGLTAVKIPNTVTSIGDYVFYECRQLGDIKIPSSVTTIGTGIFLGDEKLDHFVFPKNVINLGSQKPLPLD